MAEAVGIHADPERKLGRREPEDKPALMLADILTGVVPEHPPVVDHFGTLEFGLYANDRFGVCGPVSVANLIRLLSGALGPEVKPSQSEVFDLYRRSGNPDFDPLTGADDNGVEMQTMLDALLKGGIGRIKPVAFAKVNATDDAELEAAMSIFGGILWGVNLETAQQAQTDAMPPLWSHRPNDSPWGGHAVLAGAYEAGRLEDVISWAIRVETTAGFRALQLEEAWVVIFDWHLEHPAFQQGVDLSALAAAYTTLTGRILPIPDPTPIPPIPPPVPSPGSADASDVALWQSVGGWASKRWHAHNTTPVAKAMVEWAKGKGLA